MNRILIIIPGGGDPNHVKYQPAYNLIIEEAKKRNYKRIETLTFQGHQSHHKKGYINLNASVKNLKKKIKELDSEGIQYDIIARSYGCSIFFELYRKNKDMYKLLNKAVLWGPSPYHVYYYVGFENLEDFASKGEGRGMIVNNEIFTSMYPFERHVKSFRNDMKIRIVTGEYDEYCSPYFLEMLKNENPKNEIEYKVIKGIPHVVVEYNKQYLDALFNDIK